MRDDSDSDSDDGEAPLQDAFASLCANGVAALHSMCGDFCCPGCADDAMFAYCRANAGLEYYDGYAYYTIADALDALDTGSLALRVGPDADAREAACRALWDTHARLTWDGREETPILVDATDPADVAMLEAATARFAARRLELRARTHRMARLLRAMRVSTVRRRIAGRRIARAVTELHLRPGGLLTRPAATRFRAAE